MPKTILIPLPSRDFDPTEYFAPKQLGTLDRISQFAVVAAREAVADAALQPGDPALAKADIVIGVGVGGMNTVDDSFYRIYGEQGRGVHPLTIPKLMANAPASQISMDLGLHGNSFAVSSACASGTHAIGLAFRSILQAMARPGTIHDLTGALPPPPLSIAAGVALLTLADPSTPVHLAGAADTRAAQEEILAMIPDLTGVR